MGEVRRIRRPRVLPRAAGLAVAATLTLGTSALGAFPDDPPNDPAYAPAEQGGPEVCSTESGENQQHYLYSFIPKCTPNATDAEGSAGMFVDRAWKRFTTGNARTVIAYIEGGINWHDDPEELANRVFLNAGELPRPTTPKRDGALSARDYSNTRDANGNGLVDPEDLIVRYSDGVDDDGNGYVDDISGWDFYNDQNDPATLDSAYDHANGQMKQAAAETNNGIGEAGICPRCRVLPIKAGAEALDRTDDLAQAWLYAADMNADVLVSVTADLGFSSFMLDAVNEVWRRGTLPVEASNDFNSIDHQGGMFWPHVLPGNGMVANTHGLDQGGPITAVQNGLTTTYRSRSAYTSWGTHNMFTAATTGGTTSEATPTVGGVMALVLAYGKEAAAKRRIARPLTPSEAVQVVRMTSSDVTENPNPPNGWPAKPGFDLQYGYGRPNVLRAMEAVSENRIPPEAWFNSPRWYALYDPLKTRRVRIRGHLAAPRARRYRWVLQYAPGPEPAGSEFKTLRRGSAAGPRNGLLGTLDLNRIPRSFWTEAMSISATKTLPTNDQYTVTLRIRTFARGLMGEERRAIAVHHDPTLRRGFPRFIGPGGESQPVFADLQGRGRQAIVFGDADGRVHALGPRGSELPGFPVRTDRTVVERAHRGVDPGSEPLFTNLAVGDLDGDGRQWIVGTSSSGKTYVWDSRGHRRRGWPKTLDKAVRKPAIPRPQRPFTRPRIQGAAAPPVLVNLDSDRKLEIVQAGWDGHLHAWNPSGANQRGFPVRVTLPAGTAPPAGQVKVEDQKLDLPPTVAELDGDPFPELIQRTQYAFTPGAGLQVPNGGISHVVAYEHTGGRVPGWLISDQALAFYYGSAQEFVTEGVNNPVAADVDGDGRTEIASAAGIFSPTSLYNADGSSRAVYAPLPGSLVSIFTGGAPTSVYLDLLNGNIPDDVPVNFTTSGAFGRFGAGNRLSYAEPGSGAATVAGSLLFSGSGLPINSYMRAFDAQSAASVPGFPARAQGLDFLGAPAIADVSGDGAAEVIQGGDSSALHAFGETGAQTAGFPKFHTGWVVFGPSVGDIEGDGRNEVAAATREGYLMVWKTPGRAEGNQEWWSYRHDERNTGLYGIDTRPPGVARRARLRCGTLSFLAPGDDWYNGTPARYRVVLKPAGSSRQIVGVGATGVLEAGKRFTIKGPSRGGATVRAIDDAGNRGRTVRVSSSRPEGGCR